MLILLYGVFSQDQDKITWYVLTYILSVFSNEKVCGRDVGVYGYIWVFMYIYIYVYMYLGIIFIETTKAIITRT